MTVKFVHISDVHLDRNQHFKSEHLSGIRRMDFFDAWLDLCYQISAMEIDFVLLCGDLYDTSRPSELARSCAAEGLKVITGKNISVYAIWGNHDKPVGADGLSPLHRLAEEGYISRLFGDRDMESTVIPAKNVVISGMSWNPGHVNRIVQDTSYPSDMTTIIMLHHGLSGPDSLETETRMHLEREFDYVALGHIHKPYHFGKIHMPGSVLPCNRAEAKWFYSDRPNWDVAGPVIVSVDNQGVTDIQKLELDRRGYFAFDLEGKSGIDQMLNTLAIVSNSCSEILSLKGEKATLEEAIAKLAKEYPEWKFIEQTLTRTKVDSSHVGQAKSIELVRDSLRNSIPEGSLFSVENILQIYRLASSSSGAREILSLVKEVAR